MEVTELGMVMEIKPSHPENALKPMEEIDPGIVIDVNLLQFLKCLFSNGIDRIRNDN